MHLWTEKYVFVIYKTEKISIIHLWEHKVEYFGTEMKRHVANHTFNQDRHLGPRFIYNSYLQYLAYMSFNEVYLSILLRSLLH